MRWFPAALALALAAALTFLTLPIVAIFVDSSPGELIDSLGEQGALDALWLSLRTTATALRSSWSSARRPPTCSPRAPSAARRCS